MPITCETFAPTYFERLRLTRVDNCGDPIYGRDTTWVVDTPVSVQVTRNMQEAETTSLTLPDGRVCRSVTRPARLLNHTIAIGLCSVDPALMVALNESNTPVHDYLFRIVGWDETMRGGNTGVAIEGWMPLPSDGSSACDIPSDPGDLVGEGRWGYIGFYHVTGFIETGDVTYGTDATAFTITGTANPRSGWGTGPYPVQLNPGAPPSPGPFITPVPGDTAKRVMNIDVAPPDVTCGPMPLSNPAAPLIYITPGANSMEMCVQVLTDGGTWVVDFDDGSPTQTFQADEQVCHQYVDEGCYNISVWAETNPRLYRGEHWCLPQTLALDVVPDSGEVPLDVVANITGASGTSQPVIDWGDR